jgi:hypothetical protein
MTDEDVGDFEDEDVKIRRPLFREILGEGSQRTIVEVDLVIKTNGDLIVDGWDFGAAPRELFGDSDYEYWLTIRSEDKARVLEELLAESKETDTATDKDALLIDLLLTRFGNSRTPDGDFQKWLDVRAIPYSFDSWV